MQLQLDKKRNELAEKGRFKELRKSYRENKSVNLNTGKFWDTKIEKSTKTTRLDEMTKDRIKTAVNFIKKDANKVIDIGFGYGDFLRLAREKFPNIALHGLDISKKAVASIKKEITGEFKVGKIQKISFSNKSFDAVVALEVIEHIPALEVFNVYKEIKRIMKKNSQLIISVPVFEKYTLKYNPNNHMRSYTPKLFLEELKLAGFKVEKYKTITAFSSLYWLKKVLNKIFKNKWKPNIIIASCTIKQ